MSEPIKWEELVQQLIGLQKKLENAEQKLAGIQQRAESAALFAIARQLEIANKDRRAALREANAEKERQERALNAYDAKDRYPYTHPGVGAGICWIGE